jgi:hypothetical protein
LKEKVGILLSISPGHQIKQFDGFKHSQYCFEIKNPDSFNEVSAFSGDVVYFMDNGKTIDSIHV